MNRFTRIGRNLVGNKLTFFATDQKVYLLLNLYGCFEYTCTLCQHLDETVTPAPDDLLVISLELPINLPHPLNCDEGQCFVAHIFDELLKIMPGRKSTGKLLKINWQKSLTKRLSGGCCGLGHIEDNLSFNINAIY